MKLLSLILKQLKKYIIISLETNLYSHFSMNYFNSLNIMVLFIVKKLKNSKKEIKRLLLFLKDNWLVVDISPIFKDKK